MKNVYDLGDKAFFYSRTPTPHYKYEVYKLFNTIINSQRHAKTILDVGAGNGALEIEYKKLNHYRLKPVESHSCCPVPRATDYKSFACFVTNTT